MPSGVLPWVYPIWDSLGFLDLGGYFLPHFREVFSYYLLEYFLMAFLFVFFFWDSYDLNVRAFDIVPEVSKVVLTSFNSFFLSALFISTILFSTSLILYSGSVILLLVPSRMFFYLIYCIIHWLSLFYFFRSLLNISCILSILVSRLFICNSILFLRFLDHF